VSLTLNTPDGGSIEVAPYPDAFTIWKAIAAVADDARHGELLGVLASDGEEVSAEWLSRVGVEADDILVSHREALDPNTADTLESLVDAIHACLSEVAPDLAFSRLRDPAARIFYDPDLDNPERVRRLYALLDRDPGQEGSVSGYLSSIHRIDPGAFQGVEGIGLSLEDENARFATAISEACARIARTPGRRPESGLLEESELGPALKRAIEQGGLGIASLNAWHEIRHWTRPETEVDVLVRDAPEGDPLFAIETKVWDVGHQLFDLAKITCLLAAGIPRGYLLCVAKKAADFELHAGGVLFPREIGEVREHSFSELIETYRAEWSSHVGKAQPEPTQVPACVTTAAVVTGVALPAYPGHLARAVEVRVIDPKPVRLIAGFPAG